MDKKHHNELIDICQNIYSQATDTLSNYLSTKYCGVDSESECVKKSL